MKKLLLITLCLIPLVTGCKNKMDELNQNITNLTKSMNATKEKNNAITLNNFSINNHISYSLEITSDDKTINIADLNKNINNKLKVTIKAGKLSEIWAPIDNNNIYILLRE